MKFKLMFASAGFGYLLALVIVALMPVSMHGDILNFDKRLTGTDKMIFVQPPDGVTWKILSASVGTEKFYPGITFRAWIEDGPYGPYRDPVTGEMIGCFRCLTLISASAETNYFFPIVGGYSDALHGRDLPITITGPNRLAVAFTPPHGALPEDINVFFRIQIEGTTR